MEVKVNIHTDEAKKAMAEAMTRALEAVGLAAEGDAKMELESSPRRVDTGRLRNSITHQVGDDESGKYVAIGTNVDYAIYVHEGTGIYAAEGNGRKTPWFYTDDNGETHFTRGMKPNRFLRNAVEKNLSKYQQLIEQELRKE